MDHCDKCMHSETIKSLKERDGEFVETLRRFEEKLDRIVESVAKIMLLENAHLQHKEALGRAFDEIAELKKKVGQLTDDRKERDGAVKLFKIIWPIIWAASGGVGVLALMQLKYIMYLLGHAQGG
jgi:hypothetical protein